MAFKVREVFKGTRDHKGRAVLARKVLKAQLVVKGSKVLLAHKGHRDLKVIKEFRVSKGLKVFKEL